MEGPDLENFYIEVKWITSLHWFLLSIHLSESLGCRNKYSALIMNFRPFQQLHATNQILAQADQVSKMYQRYLRYRFASCLSCLLGRSTPDWHPQLSLHKPYLDRFCQRLHMEPWRRETCLRPFSLELFGWPCGVCREHFGPVACFGATGTKFPECLKSNPEFSIISTQQSILIMRVTS